MTRTTLLALLIVLTLIGIIDSTYLSISAANSDPLVCDIGGLTDCNLVAESPYSRLMGIPLAVYGLGFYGVILLLSISLLMTPSRKATYGLIAATVLGALASLYFLYLQIMVIQALCIYCLISAAVSFLLCALTLGFWRRLLPVPPAVLP